MAILLAEVQTSQGKDVAKVYRTPNEDHDHEIRTIGSSSETERIHDAMSESYNSISSNTIYFLKSIDHPDSDSDLRVNIL